MPCVLWRAMRGDTSTAEPYDSRTQFATCAGQPIAGRESGAVQIKRESWHWIEQCAARQ